MLEGDRVLAWEMLGWWTAVPLVVWRGDGYSGIVCDAINDDWVLDCLIVSSEIIRCYWLYF